jgi:hypothetical protein
MTMPEILFFCAVRYLSPDQSPNGQPMLVVAGSDTGTISLFSVRGMRSRKCANIGGEKIGNTMF